MDHFGLARGGAARYTPRLPVYCAKMGRGFGQGPARGPARQAPPAPGAGSGAPGAPAGRAASGPEGGVMLAKPLLSDILTDEGLTRGLGDPEARVLVEWLVDQAEGLADQPGETAARIRGLCRRGRAIG